MGSGMTSPGRQQKIFKLLFDRKTTKVKIEDNLQIEVKRRLFGVEYQKENLQGNVKVEVRKTPVKSLPISVANNVEINVEIKALCQPGKSRTSERIKKRLNISTVPQETIRTYLKPIPKPTMTQETDNMEERDTRKKGNLAEKPLGINILAGNEGENARNWWGKEVT